MNSYQLIIDSLSIRFLHIKHYELDYKWQASHRTLHHSVLWIVQKGSFLLEVDQIRYTCKENQLCILPAHTDISYRAISSELSLTSINFDAEIALLSNRSWGHVLNLPVVFDQNVHSLGPLIQDMVTHIGDTSPFVSLLMQSSLLRMLYELMNREMPEQPISPYSHMDNRIHTIIHYLLSHPSRMPEIRELAELVQLSDSHLRKLFIKQTGQAPLHFVHSLKIEQAKRLLATSVKPISQISYELGVDNANYFTRMFKAKSGLTPVQYRQQYGLWLNE
ncbi:helix-turn-helix domain-containing protein [Paenibacillus sp. GCM10023248]|uniref:helix-turn-helix domain-containing protein n=1 Tax=Bacillales TaxID=1385 RepID=UPI002377E049|nr:MULTISPECIES: AraC family transcriptional regulator [Bacillales]MDD9267391.1 AraC family transcriptional regulator [Paenibacillus sp. MAHUQ-63]MDR6882606.1 AraC-like DNA-binding protein [Bacillus sp. 3255]